MGLAKAMVVPTLAVTDLDRARAFYGDKLGLEESSLQSEGEKSAVYELGGGSYLYVYERSSPSGSSSTACEFQVEDVEGAVRTLREAGVTFEEYDLPEMGLKTENGIATIGEAKVAWFKDPFGNILAVGNSVPLARARQREGGRRGAEQPMHA